MNPGTGLPFIAEGALTRGMALVVGTAYPQVKVTAAANAAVIGYALNDAASGQEVAIVPVNYAGKCKAIAGASFSRGNVLQAEGADGRLKVLVPGTSLQYAVGIALEDGADGQLVDILPCFFISVGAGA